MSIKKYDFSSLEKKEEDKDVSSDEDPRKNFRIGKSCANCKYYYYTGVKSRRGFCKLPNPQYFNTQTKHNPHIEDFAVKKGWPRTHCTNICDMHELRSVAYSIEAVGKYIGKTFDINGDPVD